jgi:EmrB/QacA subfamily drug resistance transporter
MLESPVSSPPSPPPNRPAASPAPFEVTPAARRLLPWLMAVALFMESLDATILNTAVPTIASALRVPPLSMKAALTSYTLSLAVFIPLSGWVADRFGTRRVFMGAVAIFTLGSAACGFSVDMPTLVASRILQGCGGALMVPVGRITLVRTYPRAEFLRATAFVAIPALIGPLVGPLAGGLIVAYSHWRTIFFVNLPIGVAGIGLAYRFMPDYRENARTPLDLLGLVLFGAGVALVSYVLEIFGEHTLGVRVEALLMALGVGFLVAYGLHAAHREFPLLRLGYFRIRTFRIAVVGSFVTRLGIGGMPFLLPLLYQLGLGHTPVGSGLLIMPQPLAAMGVRLITPRLLRMFGYRRVLVVNTLLIGVVIMLFATVGPGTPVWMIILQATAFGFLSSLQFTSMNTLAYADLAPTQASMGATIASTFQQMSMSFGVAAASLTTALFLGDHGHHANSPAMIVGIHRAFLALGAITAVSSLTFLELRARDGASMVVEAKPEERTAE